MTQVLGWPSAGDTYSPIRWGDDAGNIRRRAGGVDNIGWFNYPAAAGWGKSYSPAAGRQWTRQTNAINLAQTRGPAWSPELRLFVAATTTSARFPVSPDGLHLAWRHRPVAVDQVEQVSAHCFPAYSCPFRKIPEPFMNARVSLMGLM